VSTSFQFFKTNHSNGSSYNQEEGEGELMSSVLMYISVPKIRHEQSKNKRGIKQNWR